MIRKGSGKMAEPRDDRSALLGHLRAGNSPAGDAAAGVTLAERWPLAILQIDRLPGGPADRSAVAQMPGAPPLLQVGPGRWLVVDRRDRRDRLESLTASLDRAADAGFVVTDLSQARTVLRIAGRKARDVLAKGCALDLHPGVFPVGSCAATSVVGLAAVLVAVDDAPTYDLHVARTYGQYVWEWMCEAAAEYGYSTASG
jgi:heterotetrameric sarcosine oxidase gamma subunit